MGLYQWVLHGVNPSLRSGLLPAYEISRHVNLQRAIDNISKTFGRPVVGIHSQRYSIAI